MKKPLLLVVTGSIASGKTTLSKILAGNIYCPLLSRDELKEGLLHTLDTVHSQLVQSVDQDVYETFFETIEFLISRKISLIVEAAFQDKLWKPKLLELQGKADIKIIICTTKPDLVKTRFANRLLNNSGRDKFHGDQALNSSTDQFALLTEHYKPVNINVPTLIVDTTGNYRPGIEAIISFIEQTSQYQI